MEEGITFDGLWQLTALLAVCDCSITVTRVHLSYCGGSITDEDLYIATQELKCWERIQQSNMLHVVNEDMNHILLKASLCENNAHFKLRCSTVCLHGAFVYTMFCHPR